MLAQHGSDDGAGSSTFRSEGQGCRRAGGLARDGVTTPMPKSRCGNELRQSLPSASSKAACARLSLPIDVLPVFRMEHSYPKDLFIVAMRVWGASVVVSNPRRGSPETLETTVISEASEVSAVISRSTVFPYVMAFEPRCRDSRVVQDSVALCDKIHDLLFATVAPP